MSFKMDSLSELFFRLCQIKYKPCAWFWLFFFFFSNSVSFLSTGSGTSLFLHICVKGANLAGYVLNVYRSQILTRQVSASFRLKVSILWLMYWDTKQLFRFHLMTAVCFSDSLARLVTEQAFVDLHVKPAIHISLLTARQFLKAVILETLCLSWHPNVQPRRRNLMVCQIWGLLCSPAMAQQQKRLPSDTELLRSLLHFPLVVSPPAR